MTHHGDVRIRQATPADAAQVAACAEAAFAPYVPLIGRKPAPMLADFNGQIAAGDVWVATDPHDRVLGYVVFRPAGLHMELDSVAILPTAAGRGLGRGLIAFCEDAARRQGLAAVHLHTNAAMAANLILYPRLGYSVVGRGRADGFDRVYFSKALN